MKNQYFGDINDYKKYSLLRLLGGHGQQKGFGFIYGGDGGELKFA